LPTSRRIRESRPVQEKIEASPISCRLILEEVGAGIPSDSANPGKMAQSPAQPEAKCPSSAD